MNNFWLKKCEKSVTDVRKEKTKERVFLVNDRECFAVSHFVLPIKTRFFKDVNIANYTYRISSNKLRPLISAAPPGIHIEISASL